MPLDQMSSKIQRYGYAYPTKSTLLASIGMKTDYRLSLFQLVPSVSRFDPRMRTLWCMSDHDEDTRDKAGTTAASKIAIWTMCGE